MVNRYYAGIGSRETPEHAQQRMTKISKWLSRRGWILRSGGAEGADRAFEKGAGDNKEIFYAKDSAHLWTHVFTEHFHPAPQHLKDFPRKLMNRNANQILGKDGNTPVEFVICWTKDGKASGGTGQAIRIAEFFNIPVYNLYNSEDVKFLRVRLDELVEG